MTAIKETALASTVTTIRARLLAMKVVDPTVMSKGDQIVVEFSSDAAQTAVARSMLTPSGKLEFKIVNDGAAYMRRLYANVNDDEQAGTVVPEIDQWHSDSGTTHTDYYLRAPDGDAVSGRHVIERYLADLALKDPSFAVPDDRQIGYELIEPAHGVKDEPSFWRTYYLERAAIVTGADVAHAVATTDVNTRLPSVTLEFNRSGAQLFGDATSQMIGKKLAISVDDTIKSAPIVNDAIRGGSATIAMGIGDPEQQLKERDALVGMLKSGALPTPLREVSVTTVP